MQRDWATEDGEVALGDIVVDPGSTVTGLVVDAGLTPAETEIFWRERVRLMESLVQLRYAQVQRTGM